MAAGNWTAGQQAYAKSVNEAIRVNGLTELVKAFRELDPKVKRRLQAELRKIAEPAAYKARRIAFQKLSPIGMAQQRTIMGIRPGSRLGMAVVRQAVKGTTKDHESFGPWQVVNLLEPAAEATMPEAEQRIEAMLDKVATEFNAGVD